MVNIKITPTLNIIFSLFKSINLWVRVDVILNGLKLYSFDIYNIFTKLTSNVNNFFII